MLPKGKRLTAGKEIRRILDEKQLTSRSPLLYLVARPNSLPNSRVAVIVSGKQGNAVLRNRIRRRLRASLVNIWHNIGKNKDMVLLAKRKIIDLTASQLAAELAAGFRRLNAGQNG